MPNPYLAYAAMLVTRVDSREKTALGFSIRDEMFGNSKITLLVAATSMVLALVPGLGTAEGSGRVRCCSRGG